jgi:hypothetical protein
MSSSRGCQWYFYQAVLQGERSESRIRKLAPEKTVECSTKLKLSVEAHGTECLMHNLCGMDGDERVATLTMPKSAPNLRSIRRIVSGF